MLRYLEQEGLVVPARSEAGYRRYGIRELNQLNTLAELRTRFGVELGPGCALSNLAVVGPGAVVGSGNVLDHGLRIGADHHIPGEALRFS